MNILICDFPQEMKRDLAYEVQLLQQGLAGAQVEVMPYRSRKGLAEKLKGADALLTAFLPLDAAMLQAADHLQLISLNATGCNTVDLQAARQLGIRVAHVASYCTNEVAEHTMAMLLALTRQLKAYDNRLQQGTGWSFLPEMPLQRLAGQTMAVFGFGKIAQAVVQRAQAFGIHCLAVSSHLTTAEAAHWGVQRATVQEALQAADIISNHMQQTSANTAFFSREIFQAMQKKPVFLNMARGEAVDEQALAEALTAGWIRAAGLDVFAEEGRQLAVSPFLHRRNVILTPHAAFYSETSVRELQRTSCAHIQWFFQGDLSRIHSLVA